MRAGAPKPDIGSVEAFKRALLAAKSVVRSREGASGAMFEAVMERLGIAEAMRDKIVIAGSGRVAEFVARGEAELAVQQISELVPVQGADFVGPFPPELQHETVFAAGVASASRRADTGRSLHRPAGGARDRAAVHRQRARAGGAIAGLNLASGAITAPVAYGRSPCR